MKWPWVREEGLLVQYTVTCRPGGEAPAEIQAITERRSLPSRYPSPQARLWGEEALRQVEWHKVQRLRPHVRRTRWGQAGRTGFFQPALFA